MPAAPWRRLSAADSREQFLGRRDARELAHERALAEDEQRGNRLDAELRGQFRIGIHINKVRRSKAILPNVYRCVTQLGQSQLTSIG